MLIMVLKIMLLVLYIACNVLTAAFYSAKRMREEFIEGECLVGLVFANLFYAPAWILKGLKMVVVSTIA